MKLYSFFRSGSSHRLRIALNFKGVVTDYVPVDMRTEEHLKETFRAIHPQGFLPALDTGDQVLIQSPAIIEWLEEIYPTPALLPANESGRVHVRALAALMGCDIHPINNRRILQYLRNNLGANEDVLTNGAQRGLQMASMPTKHYFLPINHGGSSATAMPLLWPMCTWCLRLRVHAALKWT